MPEQHPSPPGCRDAPVIQTLSQNVFVLHLPHSFPVPQKQAVQFLLMSRDLSPRAAARAGFNWSLLARLNHLQTGTVHKDRINKILDHSSDLVYLGALSSFLTSVTHLPWIKRLHNSRDWENKDKCALNWSGVWDALLQLFEDQRVMKSAMHHPKLTLPPLLPSPVPCVNAVHLGVLGGAGSPSQTVLLTPGVQGILCSVHVLQL